MLNHPLLKLVGGFESPADRQRRISVRVGVEPKPTLSRRNVDAPDRTDLHGLVPPKRPDLPDLFRSHHDAPLKDGEESVGQKFKDDQICGYFRPLCQLSIHITYPL